MLRNCTQISLREDRIASRACGFPATTRAAVEANYHALTTDYAASQERENGEKARKFLVPLLEKLQAHSVLDAGCGIGTMVATLLDLGFEAHGFDLIENIAYWVRQDLSTRHFVVTDPDRLILPYDDSCFDFAFSFGVIEHIGTTDGNATRRRDYHEIRRQWTRELFRVVRVGGHMLLAGPNKGFPIDTAHGLDAEATWLERRLSRLANVSVHRTWGDNFLWCYNDVDSYLNGLPHYVMPLSVEELLNFSRVPRMARALARSYVAHLPRTLLRSGFNPWVMALVRRDG